MLLFSKILFVKYFIYFTTQLRYIIKLRRFRQVFFKQIFQNCFSLKNRDFGFTFRISATLSLTLT